MIYSNGMGAKKSIHAGNAKVDFNVDFTHKLCAALMLHPFRNASGENSLSLIIGSLCVKHPNLFGQGEKLNFLWDKGLRDSNILFTYRKPKSEWLLQHGFTIQETPFVSKFCATLLESGSSGSPAHTLSPELGIHGIPVDNLSRIVSGGVNLSRFCAGVDLVEPASNNWSIKTSVKFEHVRPVNDDGRSISRDLHGLPVTCSGGYYDSMVVVKQESRYAEANDRTFSQFSLQIEQGIAILSKWLIFNKFKFVASKGLKLGPAFLLTSLTGGSIVGDIAPYQAFTIGGQGSVRGYAEGAVGSGRSCLIANSELTFSLNPMVEGVAFLDCGSDMGTGRLVPGNPGLRHGKPGHGLGVGYGVRLKSRVGYFQVDYAVNAFQQRTVYIKFSNIS